MHTRCMHISHAASPTPTCLAWRHFPPSYNPDACVLAPDPTLTLTLTMMSQAQQQQQQQQPEQQQQQVIHLLLSRAARERQVPRRLTSQPQQQEQQEQEEEQVIRLLVSRAASERQVSSRLTSQPGARGGRSGDDEGCGGVSSGTVRAPRDAGETAHASLISGAGSGTIGLGASGGASGANGGANRPGELLVNKALGLRSVPEEHQMNSNSASLSQAGRHRPGQLSEFGGIHGWMEAARRKAVAGKPKKKKVISHRPPPPDHSPPAYIAPPAPGIPLTAHRTPHTAE